MASPTLPQMETIHLLQILLLLEVVVEVTDTVHNWGLYILALMEDLVAAVLKMLIIIVQVD